MNETIQKRLEEFDSLYFPEVGSTKTQIDRHIVSREFIRESMNLAADRREKELLIVADELERSGWTFTRYLKAWVEKLKTEGKF